MQVAKKRRVFCLLPLDDWRLTLCWNLVTLPLCCPSGAGGQSHPFHSRICNCSRLILASIDLAFAQTPTFREPSLPRLSEERVLSVRESCLASGFPFPSQSIWSQPVTIPSSVPTSPNSNRKVPQNIPYNGNSPCLATVDKTPFPAMVQEQVVLSWLFLFPPHQIYTRSKVSDAFVLRRGLHQYPTALVLPVQNVKQHAVVSGSHT